MLPEENRKTARVDLRISPREKALFERAAQAKGLNLTSYIITTESNDAKDTVERKYRISLTNKSAQTFLEALDAEPNAKLTRAARDFERLTS